MRRATLIIAQRLPRANERRLIDHRRPRPPHGRGAAAAARLRLGDAARETTEAAQSNLAAALAAPTIVYLAAARPGGARRWPREQERAAEAGSGRRRVTSAAGWREAKQKDFRSANLAGKKAAAAAKRQLCSAGAAAARKSRPLCWRAPPGCFRRSCVRCAAAPPPPTAISQKSARLKLVARRQPVASLPRDSTGRDLQEINRRLCRASRPESSLSLAAAPEPSQLVEPLACAGGRVPVAVGGCSGCGAGAKVCARQHSPRRRRRRGSSPQSALLGRRELATSFARARVLFHRETCGSSSKSTHTHKHTLTNTIQVRPPTGPASGGPSENKRVART